MIECALFLIAFALLGMMGQGCQNLSARAENFLVILMAACLGLSAFNIIQWVLK